MNPNIAYEVEFSVAGGPLRLLLLDEQVAPCAERKS
jgi:hypothetical protein